MDGGGQTGVNAREVRNDAGSLRVACVSPSVLLVEMEGAIGLPHVLAMTQYVDEAIPHCGGKLSIFQDLTRVTSYKIEAQVHVSTWALERSGHVDRLHFALNAGSPLIATVRAVVIALPIRAYMYKDRAGLDAALQRALPKAS
jgi:hypothetical protein